MKLRRFGKQGPKVTEVGLGTWQIGGAEWGDVDESAAMGVLQAAEAEGIRFIDTADIYGGGRSEKLIGQFLADRNRDDWFIATKLGRSGDPGWPQNFEPDTLRRHTEASLERLGIDRIDLTQTHCIPPAVAGEGRVFAALRSLRDEGLIGHVGASVESVDEANLCIDRGVESLQVIFNIFRRKPLEMLFERAQRSGVAIIVRLPLASGLLAGKFTAESRFADSDHRTFNRDGQAFNVGETFAGLPFEKGVALAEGIRPLVPPGGSMAAWAIRWCLDFDAVTTVIPGRSAEQVACNASASKLPKIDGGTHAELERFYRIRVAPHIRGPY